MPSSEMVEKARAAFEKNHGFGASNAVNDRVERDAKNNRAVLLMAAFAESAVRDAVSECANIVEQFYLDRCSYYNNSPSPYVKGLCRDLAAALRKKYGVADGGKS